MRGIRILLTGVLLLALLLPSTATGAPKSYRHAFHIAAIDVYLRNFARSTQRVYSAADIGPPYHFGEIGPCSYVGFRAVQGRRR